MYQCAYCNNLFTHHRKKKYCSVACRDEATKRRINKTGKLKHELMAETRERNTYTCQYCGKEYYNKRCNTDGTKYCSRVCAFADAKNWNILSVNGNGEYCELPKYCRVYFNQCVICDGWFSSRAGKKTVCSSKCNTIVYGRRKKGVRIVECKKCGNDFEVKYGSARRVFCSKRCSNRYERRLEANSTHRKRARKYGVDYEYINRIKIFERDGWRCQICLKPTPRKNIGTMKPNAPELDHRIPMSKGGGHVKSNVQCACRQCNNEKGNSSNIGQFSIEY